MKFVKKTDLVILAVALVVCAAAWFSYQSIVGKKAAKAEIYYKSELADTVDLTAGVDKRFSIEQNKNVIFHVFKDGSICFEESNCPDKICIRAGRLHTIGESAACLPNGIVMKIVAKDQRSSDDLDAVIG
ncbi:NusG domain II-containing protein [Caproiciproducens sp. R2]|uniref:NusG domain II-containing protein n=1 Tax=Caproiciproducens sp. R2 TaxID=3435187 RepID=UPI004034D146